MFNHLNFYSRYNRSKYHKQLISLYNLFVGVNIDNIANQSMHLTLPSKHSPHFYLQTSKQILSGKQSDSYRSCDSKHARNKQYIDGDIIYENKMKENQRKDKDSENISMGGNRNRFNNYSENNNEEQFFKTVSSEVENYSDQGPKSPKMEDNVKYFNSNHINHKFSSIESFDVKKCSSIDQNQSCKGVNQPLYMYNDPLRDSSHQHREEDIYSSQFMNQINKLAKLDQQECKSTQEKGTMQEHLKISKSQLLERIHGSEIDLSDNQEQRGFNVNINSKQNKKNYSQFNEDQSSFVDILNQDEEEEERQEEIQTIKSRQKSREKSREKSGKEKMSQAQVKNEENNKNNIIQIRLPSNSANNNFQPYTNQTPNKQNNNKQQQQDQSIPFNNLYEIKQTKSEEQDKFNVQKSNIITRFNFPQQDSPQLQSNPLASTAPPTNRKSFKKVIQHKKVVVTPPPHNDFKETKKLNPRLVTSTIVPESAKISQNKNNKVNFKKALIRGEENQEKVMLLKEKKIEGKNSRGLLQAFFEQN